MKNNNNGCTKKEQLECNYHIIHKLPPGDSPYVRAKYAQLVEKDAEAAIVLFWKAINAGDRVDSALKDMAVVMKQQDRAEEAIEAIKSFRDRCSKQAQESLDNVLIDLYKKCGKLEEQIELLKQKLRMIYQGEVFNGKPTKTARSHGRKFQVTIKQETSRILVLSLFS
uniref:Protein SULFUR DEFICIENCY-INDUCED 1 n=1 Tax=Solanum tuberosum TaxID=4113 RepID=M1CWC4_SOLTU